MIHRRRFLARSAGILGATLSPDLFDFSAVAAALDAGNASAEDEAFWAQIRSAIVLDPEVVNLDHGWTNPTPLAALDELIRIARELQSLPAERLAKLWPEVTNTVVRKALADALGVDGAEMALVRNATEALDTVLLGVPLNRGDEIVCSAHDYYAMLDALDQREARDGVVLRMIHPPVPAPSMDALAELYEAAIGPRTRLVLLTHPSNLTGQLLPVRRIVEAAHGVGAEVVIDGAQSLGVLEGSIYDLGADYYGASCHKWLAAPIGMGVLWMKPEHTEKVWPLIPAPPSAKGVSRYEWIGTSPEYVSPAALPALAIHSSLGPARKAARLRYLNSYMRRKIESEIPDARFYTLPDEAMSISLLTVEFPSRNAAEIQKRLRAEYNILVQDMSGRKAPEIRGIRISPNVYTTPAELDTLVEALKAVTAA